MMKKCHKYSKLKKMQKSIITKRTWIVKVIFFLHWQLINYFYLLIDDIFHDTIDEVKIISPVPNSWVHLTFHLLDSSLNLHCPFFFLFLFSRIIPADWVSCPWLFRLHFLEFLFQPFYPILDIICTSFCFSWFSTFHHGFPSIQRLNDHLNEFTVIV